MKHRNFKFNLIDLFAGAGGLSDGFQQTGKFKVVGVVENDKEAIETYLNNHQLGNEITINPSINGVSNICDVNFSEFMKEKKLNPLETVVIGGPPCQGFSNANRQKNYLISGNNQLVKEYARAIDKVRPVAFLMENVKTINSSMHKFFITDHIEDSIYSYSSEQHLKKINFDEDPFWEEDELILLETDKTEYKSLINRIVNSSYVPPFITSEIELSRIRSVIRKLRKTKTYNPITGKEKKELLEIHHIIDTLLEYDYGELSTEEEIISLTNTAIHAFNEIASGSNTDNKKTLESLQSFIEINQLLRYLQEIENEKVVKLEGPKVLGERRLKVVVSVMSYNIVTYLEKFFKYLGYKITTGTVHSNHYLVPQKRQRFMILGIRSSSTKYNEINFPERYTETDFTVRDAIGDLEKINPTQDVEKNELFYNSEINNTVMQSYYRSGLNKNIIYNHINTESGPLSKKRFKEIKENNGRNFHSLSQKLQEATYTDASRTQNTIYLRLDYDLPSPTVINVRKSMWQHPTNAVALSIREAARLQTFQDSYIFKGSKDKQYQQIANAVPPLMARAMAEQILYYLGEKPIKLLKHEF